MRNSLSTNQVASIVSGLVKHLSSYGIEAGEVGIKHLENSLVSTLENRLSVNVQPETEAVDDDIISIAFEISEASASQVVRVVDKTYDEESLIEGLANGRLVTTTWHELGDVASIDVVKTGQPVAIILAQEIDGSYEDFQ